MNHRAITSVYFFPALLIVLILLGSCSGGSVKTEFDWPRWRGANGDGISRETEWDPKALAGGSKILWTVNLGSGYSNVAIEDGRLYTAGLRSGRGHIYCLNADTGEQNWRYSTGTPVELQATPTVDDRNVYGLNKNGVLYCLKKGTGGLRWKRDLVSEYGAVQPYYGFAGSPVVVGDLLVLTANTSGMALNKKTGQLLWASEKPPEEFPTFGLTNTTGTDYCTPVVSADEDEHYALLSSWKGLSSVDIETGKLLWLYEWALATNGMTADPLIVGHKVYIAHGVSNLRQLVGFLLEVESGKPNVRWENAYLWSTISTPIYWEGHIYGCHNLPDNDNPDRGSLRCLNAETGELCWEQDLGQGFSLSAAAGKLIILTTRGKLHIAEATSSSYQEISSGDVLGGKRKPVKFWTPPVLCRGKLYCRDYGGDLICVDVRQRDVVARQ